MNETIILAILGIVGTIIGTTIGIGGTYFVAIRLARINNKIIADCRLREAFTSELAALKSPSLDNPPDPYELLLAAFNKHRTAIVEFRHFLRGCCQKQFDKAWYNYYSHDDSGKETTEYLLKYSSGWEHKSLPEIRNIAITNIERLLSFANPK